MGNELTQIYTAPFLLGIIYGFTVCCWSCLPYVGPYIMGTQKGFISGLKVILMFNAGKIVSYALLGAMAGYLGNVVSHALKGRLAPSISAILIIWLGGSLFLTSKGKCANNNHKKIINQHSNYLKLIILGLTVGLTPCIPLSGVLLYAATGHSALKGCVSAILFGLGTIVSPLIILGGLMGWFSNKITLKVPQYSRLFQKTCGVMLVSLGIKILLFL